MNKEAEKEEEIGGPQITFESISSVLKAFFQASFLKDYAPSQPLT